MSVNFTAADRVGVIGGYIGGIAQLLGNGGLFGGWNNGGCSDNSPVSRYELNLVRESLAKDSEISLLKSENNTETKLIDVYQRLDTKIQSNKAEQDAINREQAVYNGVNTATIGCIQNQVAQLMSLTQLKIPNTSVCPGWGNVTITPTTTTTTTTGA